MQLLSQHPADLGSMYENLLAVGTVCQLSDLLPVQGWQPRVTWIALGGCVFFTALEEAKKLYAPQKWKDKK